MHSSTICSADTPGVGSIVACHCGHFHISLGPVTLSFLPSEFKSVARLFEHAVEQLPMHLSDGLSVNVNKSRRTQ